MRRRQVIVESYGLPAAVDAYEDPSGGDLLRLAQRPEYAADGLRIYVEPGGALFAWSASAAIHRSVTAELGAVPGGPSYTLRVRDGRPLVAASRDPADLGFGTTDASPLFRSRAGRALAKAGTETVYEFDRRVLTDEEIAILDSICDGGEDGPAPG
jgi:hypothetical protein